MFGIHWNHPVYWVKWGRPLSKAWGKVNQGNHVQLWFPLSAALFWNVLFRFIYLYIISIWKHITFSKLKVLIYVTIVGHHGNNVCLCSVWSCTCGWMRSEWRLLSVTGPLWLAASCLSPWGSRRLAVQLSLCQCKGVKHRISTLLRTSITFPSYLLFSCLVHYRCGFVFFWFTNV